MKLRPFAETDYAAVTHIWNSLFPDWQRGPHEMQQLDQNRPSGQHCVRWVLEDAGQAVGYGGLAHLPGMFHPQRLALEGGVLPAYQGQGWGRALWQVLQSEWQKLDAAELLLQVTEDHPRALRFVQARGFTERKRDFVSVLSLAQANLDELPALQQRLAHQGIELRSLAQLQANDDQTASKLHGLFSQVRLDIPRSAPPTPIALEFFVNNVLSGPEFEPRAIWVALHGPQWVGFSGAFPSHEPGVLDQWMTGTLPQYRSRGVAWALKLQLLHYARSAGFVQVRTDNDSRNQAMLALNRKLGFVPNSATLTCVKTLKELSHEHSSV